MADEDRIGFETVIDTSGAEAGEQRYNQILQNIAATTEVSTARMQENLQKFIQSFQASATDAQKASTLYEAVLHNIAEVSGQSVDEVRKSYAGVADDIQTLFKDIVIPGANQQMVESERQRQAATAELAESSASRQVAAAGHVAEAAQQSGQKQISVLEMVGAVVSGNVIADGIMKVAGSFVELGKATLGDYIQEEKLTAGLRSSVAQRLRTADATLEMADALELAGTRAKELVDWSTRATLRSPFTAEQGGAVLQRTMGFGYTSREAQEITQGVLDFAAANGKSIGQVETLITAMGRMRTSGRVTYQELSQIAVAGLPIYEQLAKNMGMTVEQVQSLAISGVPAAQVLTAMQQVMGQFSGEANRQADSFGGMIQSIENMKSAGLKEFYAGIYEAARPLMVELVDWFANPKNLDAIKQFGETAGSAISAIIDALRDEWDLLKEIGKELEGTTPKGQPTVSQQAGQSLIDTWNNMVGAAFEQGEAARADPETFQRTLRENASGFINWLQSTLPGQIAGSVASGFELGFAQVTGQQIEIGLTGDAAQYLGLYGAGAVGPPTREQAVQRGWQEQAASSWPSGSDVIPTGGRQLEDYYDEIQKGSQQAEKAAAMADLMAEALKKNAYEMYVSQALARQQFERTEGRTQEDFNINRQLAERNYQIQTTRTEEDQRLSRERSLRDFAIQSQRTEEDFYTNRQRMSRDFAIQVQRIEEDNYLTRQNMARDFALQTQRSEEDYQRSREYALEDYNYSRSLSQRDYDLQTTRTEEDRQRERIRQQLNYEVQSQRMAQDYYDQLSQMTQQHNLTQEENIRANDAVAYLREERRNAVERENAAHSYSVQRRRAKEDFDRQQEEQETNQQLQDERRQEDFDRQMADQEEAFNRQQERTEEQYRLQEERRQEDYARQLEDMDANILLQTTRRNEDYARQLADMDTNFALQISRRNEDFARQLSDQDSNIALQASRRAEDYARQQSDQQIAYDRAAIRRADDFERMQRLETDSFIRRSEIGKGYYRLMNDDFSNWLAGLRSQIGSVGNTHVSGGFAEGGSFIVPDSHPRESPIIMNVGPREIVTVTPAGQSSMVGGKLEVDVNVRSNNSLSIQQSREVAQIVGQVVSNALR